MPDKARKANVPVFSAPVGGRISIDTSEHTTCGISIPDTNVPLSHPPSVEGVDRERLDDERFLLTPTSRANTTAAKEERTMSHKCGAR